MQAVSSRDEMIDRGGRLRLPWVPVMEAVHNIGPDELARRAASLNRQVHLAAPFGGGASQIYDPLPAPLTATEFASLESGIIQRARVLDALLEDIYGPQTVLRDRLVEPWAVYGNPHFIRGLRTRQRLYFPRLSLYAADLIRGREALP